MLGTIFYKTTFKIVITTEITIHALRSMLCRVAVLGITVDQSALLTRFINPAAASEVAHTTDFPSSYRTPQKYFELFPHKHPLGIPIRHEFFHFKNKEEEEEDETEDDDVIVPVR